MNRVFLAPGRVVIGEGALAQLGEYVAAFGKKALLLAHPDDFARVRDVLDASAEQYGVSFVNGEFAGECTYAEVERAAGFLADGEIGCVAGLGGGKAIDTAKVLADKQNLPVLSVPTIVSTDAPCSSMAVVYDENHGYVGNYYLKRSPALVLVDSQIIAQAPLRFLVAGMGDAWATCFEAEACLRTGAKNYGGGAATLAASQLARLCKTVLLDNAAGALLACRQKVVTPALENVIEANTLLSGLGFESVGLAAAHCMDTVLDILGANGMHGEQVAFGLLVQLVLENRPPEDVRQTLEFYRMTGLPLALKDIGLDASAIPEAAWQAAEGFAGKPGGLLENMPGRVSGGMVRAAVLCADQLRFSYP